MAPSVDLVVTAWTLVGATPAWSGRLLTVTVPGVLAGPRIASPTRLCYDAVSMEVRCA